MAGEKSPRIRLATEADAASCLEIYRPHIEGSHVSFEVEVPTLADFTGRIVETRKKFPWLVYEEGGRVGGYAYASPHRTRCAYGWSVECSAYLHADFYRRGIGTALYRRLFELLKAQGAVNVLAGITQPNPASVRLHESLGFELIGFYRDVGYKNGRWWDVGWWQLQLQRPDPPAELKPPLSGFEFPPFLAVESSAWHPNSASIPHSTPP